jgi:hypothetical protein
MPKCHDSALLVSTSELSAVEGEKKRNSQIEMTGIPHP